MKKLFMLLALVASLYQSEAATASLTVTAAATNNVIATNGVIVSAIRITGVAGTVNFGFLDAPSATTTWTSPGFTNYAFTAGYVTNIFTNIVGTIETNYYPALIYSTNGVTAFTNNFPQVVRVTGVTNTAVTVPTASGLYYQFWRGITVTNSGAGVIEIDYVPAR
jgi:hypothetical protein